MHLVEPVGHEGEQCLHCLLRIVAVGPDDQRGSALRRQHHYAHDALPVHGKLVFLDLDRGLEAPGELDELRRRSRVHAERIHDLRLALDHGHSHPARVARASSARPSRTPVSRARNDHRSAKPPAATAASATRDQPRNPPLRYCATSGRATPTTNAMARPETAVARCSSGGRSATATRTPCAHPARSAHQRSATGPALKSTRKPRMALRPSPSATPMSASPEVSGSQPAHTRRSPSEPRGPHNAVRNRSTCSGGTPSCSARAAAPTARPHRYGCALK